MECVLQIDQIKDVVDYGIIGLLIFMSILTFTFAFERVLFFRSVNLDNYKHKLSLELDLTKRLSTIASIGSNAPYIGLLGTVLAIILTFYIIGDKQDNIDTGEIMKHLALALKATAAGLVVAIPATVIYNALLSKVDRILSEWEIYQDEKARRYI
jgi:biopolymer transport protein ExbB